MKKLITCSILSIVLFGCSKPKAEFYINGKPFYTLEKCIKSETKTVWEYGFGFNPNNGKYQLCFGPKYKTTCLEKFIDTIEVK